MTVKLLMDWPDSRDGKKYIVGNLLSTDAGTESGLIAAKMATSDLSGGTAYVAPVEQVQFSPVVATKTNTGGIGVFGADGKLISGSFKKNTQVAVGAVTTEETLWEVTIPAGWMQENSELVIDWLVSLNNSAGTKTIRMYFGATQIYALAQTTVMSFRGRWKLANRNALNSQISGAALALTGYMEGGSGSGVSTFAIDFSQDQVLKITGQKSVAGDSFALEQITATVR